jgi:hypothetical protein
LGNTRKGEKHPEFFAFEVSARKEINNRDSDNNYEKRRNPPPEEA